MTKYVLFEGILAQIEEKNSNLLEVALDKVDTALIINEACLFLSS
ncbi:hypothetical protein [Acinetobacter sp. 161(2023)]